MDTQITTQVTSQSTAQGAGSARPAVSRRLLWGIAGIAAITTAVAFGWEWLTAIGLASVLVSVLPCVAMCALGLCMNRRAAAGSCHDKPAQPSDAQAEPAKKP